MISGHDLHMMALTIAGEARGESHTGKIAVAHVILNRHKKPGWWSRNRDEIPDDTIAAVCADPYQFSCFNAKDPNCRYLAILSQTAPDYLDALSCALRAYLGHEPDPTEGSTHYFDDRTPAPAWSLGKTPACRIGHHAFYNDVE